MKMSMNGYCQTAGSIVKESESEDDLRSSMHWQRVRQLCELWCESDNHVTRQATSDPGDRQTSG